MASNQGTVAFLVEQMASAGTVTTKKMFGEHTIYCDGKVVGLVCNDKLFVKLTRAGKEFSGQLEEAPAYRGAKPSLVVPAERWDDADWLAELVRLTASELPMPKKNASRKT